jgi:5-methylcytosine-specific restriction endonuclease McrA
MLETPWVPKREDQPRKSQGNHDPFYDSVQWRALRKKHIRRDPFCAYHKGTVAEGRVVDHVRPRRLYPKLELDPLNLETCCDRCHNKKRNIESRIKSIEQFEKKMKYYIDINSNNNTNRVGGSIL